MISLIAGQKVIVAKPMTYMNLSGESAPAVERSVLLRMGFSSIEAKAIVDGCIEHNLIAHGAGNVIYRLAKAQNSEIRPAGLALADGKLWDEAEKLFDGGNN